MRKGKELKAPRHASAAATCDHTWYIPNTYQRYINNVLFNYLNDFCIAYLDNIIIYLENKLEYKEYVYKVL